MKCEKNYSGSRTKKEDNNDFFFQQYPFHLFHEQLHSLEHNMPKLVKRHQRNIYERLGLRLAQDVG